jgi:hypothetical protein
MTRIIDLSGHEATVDISAGSPVDQYSLARDSDITFSLSDDAITLASGSYDYTLASNVSVTGIGIPWATDPTWSNSTSAKIQLDGPEADIEINGESLVGMLKAIEQRLNILKPNETLESEWAELRALGDQYRALEKHIMDKQATWDRLKAMPPPEIL